MNSRVHSVLRHLRRAIDTALPPQPPVPNYTGPHGCLRAAASFVAWNQVEGDYLEFGVAAGDSFIAAFLALESERREHAALGFDSPEYNRWKHDPPRYFAFDSFQGLPASVGERHVDYVPGMYGCSEVTFRANVMRGGVPEDRFATVSGFYDQSLTPDLKKSLGLTKAAMVMVDCDLYESTVPVLDFITDLVGQGTIIIFHDWFRFKGSPKQGEQRACKEWLSRNPHLELIEFWREAPQAVSFVVNLP